MLTYRCIRRTPLIPNITVLLLHNILLLRVENLAQILRRVVALPSHSIFLGVLLLESLVTRLLLWILNAYTARSWNISIYGRGIALPTVWTHLIYVILVLVNRSVVHRIPTIIIPSNLIILLIILTKSLFTLRITDATHRMARLISKTPALVQHRRSRWRLPVIHADINI